MNDTPNQTAESVIAEAMVNAGAPLMHSRVEESVAAALRANGLLSKGTPSEDDREALIDVVKRNRSVVKRMGDGYPSVAFVTDETIADAILAAGFSRATVTDAATEELDKVTLDRLQELAEERGYDKGFAAGWKSGGRTADLLAPKLRKAQAERDAALAAIERVRAEADAYAEQPDVMEPCGAVAQALRTALDGAPEPEWEYGVQYIPPSVIAGEPVKCGSERAARLAVRGTSEPIRLLRRRPKVVHPAGPWEPVEGESK